MPLSDGLGGPDAVVMAYDALGRMTATTTGMSGTGRTLSFQYDAAGRRTRVTHPDGVYFTTGYDAAGELTGAGDGDGAVLGDRL